MSSIGDLVKDNPFYTEHYKHLIPEDNFSTQISKEDLKKALIQEACIEITKKITLIALIIIPSIAILGGAAVGSGVIAGVICAITMQSNDFKSLELNIFRTIHFRANLLASLPKNKQNKDILRQLGLDTTTKAAFIGVLFLVPARVASVFASIGVCYAAYSITSEIEKLLLLCIEKHATQQAQQQYQQLQTATSG